MDKQKATEIASNLLAYYKNQLNRGAQLTMAKNAKHKTLKDQVIWLVNYCKRNNIEITLNYGK